MVVSRYGRDPAVAGRQRRQTEPRLVFDNHRKAVVGLRWSAREILSRIRGGADSATFQVHINLC